MYYIKIGENEGTFADREIALDYKKRGYQLYESAEMKREISVEEIEQEIKDSTIITTKTEKGASA